MPGYKTTLSLSEQIVNHGEQLTDLQIQLQNHLVSQPQKSAKTSLNNTFKEKNEFLVFEIKRYNRYKNILVENNKPS